MPNDVRPKEHAMNENPYKSPKGTEVRKGRWIPLIWIGAAILLAVIAFCIWASITVNRQIDDFYFPKAAP